MSSKRESEVASMMNWIDRASYEKLLRRWRQEPSGSPWFLGEVGVYYQEAMARRRAEVGNEEHVRASKAIGW